MKTDADSCLYPARFSRREFVHRVALASTTSVRDVLASLESKEAPDVIVIDPSFNALRVFNSPIQRLYTGALWSEGPAWSSQGRYLVWSDIPNNRQLRYIEDDDRVTVFRTPSGNSNGNTFDFEGRQISCEHGGRRVSRYEYNGTVTVIADRYQGKRLNSPNDVTVHQDGSIWFTDPQYGIRGNFEGNRAESENKPGVYRADPKTGQLDLITDELTGPNGICFSPDYKKLYVADTGASHYDNAPRNIKVWDIVDEKKVAKGREFASMKLDGFEKAGFADGIRADIDGNVWASAGWVGEGYDGVHVFAPDGTRIGLICLPEICSNVCFGGTKRNRLFITGSQSLYSVYVETQGAHIT